METLLVAAEVVVAAVTVAVVVAVVAAAVVIGVVSSTRSKKIFVAITVVEGGACF